MAIRKKLDPAESPEKNSSRPNTLSSDPDPSAAQIKALEQGLQLFREQRFLEARPFFERAADGPRAPVTLTARNHILVCGRRTQKPALALESADDHYHYGVERLNARDLPAARKHLAVALALRPESDYMLYAYAAALALSGDTSGAYENLKLAIAADPRNRATARQDPDFAGVANTPLFAPLLHPERF